MEKQVIRKEETKEIRLMGKAVRLPSTTLFKIPTVVRNEVEYPFFKNSGRQIDVLNQVVRMLNVNFLDDDDRRVSGGMWIDFVNGFRLTAPEVIEAYYKALRRELFDKKGELIKLYPNLSLITAGEVLDAFIEWKRKSVAYQDGKKKLEDLINKKEERPETEEEKLKRIDETIKEIKEHILAGERYDGAFVIYGDLKKSGVLEEFIPPKEEIKAIQQNYMIRLLNKERKKRFLLDVNDIKKLSRMLEEGKALPVHSLVNLDVKTDIIHKYVKESFLNRK